MAEIIPDTPNATVAVIAITWEIVRKSFQYTDLTDDTPDVIAKKMADMFNRVFRSLNEGKPIADSTPD